MAPPGHQQPPPPPPPYYQHQQHQQPHYQFQQQNSNYYAYAEPNYARPRAPPVRPRRLQWWLSVVRPWAIVAPIALIIMDIWWFATGRLCGDVPSLADECYWILWFSLPIALASIAWNLAATVSLRRIQQGRLGISSRIQLPVQFLLSAGATACVGVLGWQYTVYRDTNFGSFGLQAAILAFLSILAAMNWALTGMSAYEYHLDRQNSRDADVYVL